ncbi:lecithin retinol acyltransferase family protein [Geobacillus stearothermophilus]|uniref:lecithin retinol acyltransferase family protein n=1 Tax=Geobacillus stearothermophilus TaxID=1422 RepID=UPI002E22C3B3|nr:lecithin retinol acyltransferase family protein [Geobacillus stearothermophilus]MED3751944.1 lecithin retinol acyltransferase family protein [Geobacillus stearothermophilus]MED3756219.1 lecithin retinol acyltransferase family protein [Geobacillus stearothermophilus]MED4871185.1 lecithin retinol acyltransferase family protein [Geobacillus stearothermophilus]MED4986328.1 lecithin retinol acyltransferase family protein [Geobacillus stearothermophilus]
MEFFKNVKWFFEELHEANKEFVSGVRQDVKEFRTDMKDIVKEHNPTMGKAIEGADRLSQAIGNVIKSNPIIFEPKNTIVPDMKSILRESKEWKELKRDSELELADHLIAKRIGYTHHGLYIGNNQVIHYSEGEVRIDSLEDFKKDCEMGVVDSVATYSKEEIISRAFSRLGEKRYNLVFNNCEHFVNWCRSGGKTTDSI